MNDVNTNEAVEQHGGNLSFIASHYPDAPHPFIDLSTGINPYAYPLPPAPLQWQHRLADSADMQAAFTAIAKHYGAHNPEHVALAAGMQPLMFALATLRFKEFGVSNVTLIAPSYAEHARVWQALGHKVSWVESIEDAPQSDVVIVCNPNNPDGRVTAPEQLLTLAKQLADKKGWLIVDESFADLIQDISVTAHVPTIHNLAVLRSCGKFYGLAGMRISMAIAPLSWTQWLRAAVGPWPVTTAACHELPAILANAPWATEMLDQLESKSASWRQLLSHNFTVIGHTPLFTLVKTDNAQKWFDTLAAQGILVRKFNYNPHWLRFGLPDRAYLERLRTALANTP